jgi:7-carboxy-7-deazaguanine synthase
MMLHPQVKDIVITGGEPMMYGQLTEDLVREIKSHDDTIMVTVETNGTFAPMPDTCVDMFSISPKISTSVAVPGKTYTYNVDGEMIGKVFSVTEVEKYNKERYNPEATAALMLASDFQLKFVYSGPDSVEDIMRFLNDLRPHAGFMSSDIMLMPEGTTPDQITKNGQEAAQVCIKYGWTLADRLHIRLWGDVRGV